MQVVRPRAEALQARFAEGTEVLVSVPFYTRESLNWISPGDGGSLEFWTRLNPFDWANGVSDPEALLEFLDDLGDDRTHLRVHRALHAKIYVVDDQWAWVGSANLTVSAFNRNVEVACQLEDDEVAPVLDMVDGLRVSMTEIDTEDLRSFIEATRDVVEDHRERGEIEHSEDMQAAVDLADDVLGPATEWEEEVDIPPLDEFIAFLENQPEQAAATVVDRHFNRDDNNLQGHVKQSYFGSMLYILEPGHPDVRERLLELEFEGIPNYAAEDIRSWQDFLDRHAGLRDEARGFNLSTLRRILTERWGGYTTGGGGGNSSLKRVLPLAARFVEERDL